MILLKLPEVAGAEFRPQDVSVPYMCVDRKVAAQAQRDTAQFRLMSNPHRRRNGTVESRPVGAVNWS